MFHLRRVKWALRKATLPVSTRGLVLDVGSGGKPYPRSDVLLDRMTGAEHRCGQAMMVDRPAVFGDASKMPFKDKAFDFVVASHILEHMPDPAAFLAELSRVGKAGYIETPNAVFERFIPYTIHCLEVASVNGVLHINKKHGQVQDSFLGNLGLMRYDSKWRAFFREAPDMFHVRHYWKDKIDFEIHNPDTSCAWIEAINANSEAGDISRSYLGRRLEWRELGLKALSMFETYRRSKRLRDFDLLSILACPECHGELERKGDALFCGQCERKYTASPYPDFTVAA